MPDPIRRRSEDEVRRELEVDRKDRPVGGAEGGEESRSADAIVDVPGEPGPLGDTDQHSDPARVPPQREDENRR